MLLILLILRFPGSTAFRISTCISRMLILHVQAPRSSSPKSRWAALTPSPGEPKSRPFRRAQSAHPRSAHDNAAHVPAPDAVLRVCRL
eukprot:1975464-Prymnesium_polylepis.1